MYIGIDVGGTTLLAGLVNDNGKILHKKEKNTLVHRGYSAIKDDIIDLVKGLISEGEKIGHSIASIGIGIPGIADVEGENVIYCTNLNWNNVPLGLDLKKYFKLPVYIENDATVAALAESIIGVTKDRENSLFITLGTGVGGGIILNNKVYSGSHGVASEIGHMIVGENFYNCNCGNNGCLETFSSATAIINYGKKILVDGVKSSILDKVDGDIENLNAKIIFDCAKEGDPLANKIIDRMVKYLSIGIVNIINILDPEVIVIGGGVSKAGEFLIDKIKETIPKYILFKDINYGDVLLSKLSNDAGIIGAARLGKK